MIIEPGLCSLLGEHLRGGSLLENSVVDLVAKSPVSPKGLSLPSSPKTEIGKSGAIENRLVEGLFMLTWLHQATDGNYCTKQDEASP